MPYIHVRIGENCSSVQGSYRIDGGPENFFKYGKYIKVPNGEHIVQVNNETTVWTVRETLNTNDDLEVILFVNGFGESICAPEYYVKRDLDEKTIEYIEDSIAEAEQREYKKDKMQWLIAKWIWAVMSAACGVAMFVMAISIQDINECLIMCGVGIVFLIIAAVFVLSILKKRNTK
ncbi:MAG: hypothetical protein IKD07_07935 [Clostridia bacterium]|nr:hypothetical protein [Clostridia bacterium]